MRSESLFSAPDGSTAWTLRYPDHSGPAQVLVVFCGDWSYGILPYCGPGRVDEIWKSELKFLDLFSTYLSGKGYYTLSLTQAEEQKEIPSDEILAQIAGTAGLLTALRITGKQIPYRPEQIICIGHGLGGHIHCCLASQGIKPAAFVFAGGVFSDYDGILSQKYLPVILAGNSSDNLQERGSGYESLLIAQNLGVILHAIRKGKKKVRIENGDHPLILRLDPAIFSGTETPRCMFRYVGSPTLIIVNAHRILIRGL